MYRNAMRKVKAATETNDGQGATEVPGPSPKKTPPSKKRNKTVNEGTADAESPSKKPMNIQPKVLDDPHHVVTLYDSVDGN